MLNMPDQGCTYGNLDMVRQVDSGLSSIRYLQVESDAYTHEREI